MLLTRLHKCLESNSPVSENNPPQQVIDQTVQMLESNSTQQVIDQTVHVLGSNPPQQVIDQTAQMLESNPPVYVIDQTAQMFGKQFTSTSYSPDCTKVKYMLLTRLCKCRLHDKKPPLQIIDQPAQMSESNPPVHVIDQTVQMSERVTPTQVLIRLRLHIFYTIFSNLNLKRILFSVIPDLKRAISSFIDNICVH